MNSNNSSKPQRIHQSISKELKDGTAELLRAVCKLSPKTSLKTENGGEQASGQSLEFLEKVGKTMCMLDENCYRKAIIIITITLIIIIITKY